MEIIRINAARSAPLITLGIQGENEVIGIAFDVSEYLARWPGASVGLVVTPPQGDAYPKTVTVSNGVATWVVTSGDTAYPGLGKCQLVLTQNGTIVKKSPKYETRIIEALTATGEAPSPVTDWITDAQTELGNVQAAIVDAEAAAGAIDDLTVAASGLAAGANPTATVSEVSGHKHIAFGIPAGAKGDTGATGAQGPAGQDGAAGADGTTFTPSVAANGDLSWSNDGGKQNPATVNIKGPQGETGPTGPQGPSGQDGVGVPAGGTDGQILTKDGSTDYATKWANAPANGVNDVQVNGTSVVSGGVANVPVASANNPGAVKVNGVTKGVAIDDKGTLGITVAGANLVKQGTSAIYPVGPNLQHASVFYGLAKAAGDTTQSSSSNAVGTYTETAIDKILTMLGVFDLIANHETGVVASRAYAQGGCFIYSGKLYRATTAISISDAIIPGTNCEQTTLMAEITR
ncbi:MAG: collagen-like protein [Deltaproteobacteria bacterium]|nr:collagen-like protein [Deltaproteobacteria bacterium]